jgi:hypothetical protein
MQNLFQVNYYALHNGPESAIVLSLPLVNPLRPPYLGGESLQRIFAPAAQQVHNGPA